MEKTNQILEKSENPFVVSKLENLSLIKVIEITRRVWFNFFDNESILFDLTYSSNLNRNFLLNQDGLEILLTDIVENIHKYNDHVYKLTFLIDEEQLLIVFENDVSNYDHQKLELTKLVEDFMQIDNSKINKRKTHGVSMIKSFLNQMNIVHNLSIENKIFTLKLILK